jgi:hypothetical protein
VITLKDCDRNIAEYWAHYNSATQSRDRDLFMEGVDEWLDMRLHLMKKSRYAKKSEEVVTTHA